MGKKPFLKEILAVNTPELKKKKLTTLGFKMPSKLFWGLIMKWSLRNSVIY